MFLYTIVPAEMILGGQDAVEYSYRPVHNAYIEGVSQNGKFTVSRLFSSNPRDYLDPRYSPGQILN